jgi:hypothetical protein
MKQSLFFEKINKNDKLLVTLNKRSEKTHIYIIRGDTGYHNKY